MKTTEQIFEEALKELDELIQKHTEKMHRFKIGSENYNDQKELIFGFGLRKRQTLYLAQKFGVNMEEK